MRASDKRQGKKEMTEGKKAPIIPSGDFLNWGWVGEFFVRSGGANGSRNLTFTTPSRAADAVISERGGKCVRLGFMSGGQNCADRCIEKCAISRKGPLTKRDPVVLYAFPIKHFLTITMVPGYWRSKILTIHKKGEWYEGETGRLEKLQG